MIATREEQRNKALELMRELQINEQYVNCVKEDIDFVKKFFSWNTGNSNLTALIENLEKSKGMYIYYVTYEIFPWGECYSFLCVSKYLEDFSRTSVRLSETGSKVVHAWVENLTYPSNSEYGYIVVKNKDDGFLIRVM